MMGGGSGVRGCVVPILKLNVLKGFKPRLPEAYRKARFLLLGNNDPEDQLSVDRKSVV